MFLEINDLIKQRMKYLEEIDFIDRNNGTEKLKRLRQIPPETGKFLSIIATNSPKGDILEIGTSAGYSTLWLSLAAKEKCSKIKTFELLPEKIQLAKETFKICKLENIIELIEGDALSNLTNINEFSFCFIDCEKNMYSQVWDIVSKHVAKGGLIVADNAINHYESLKPMLEKALSDKNFDSMVVPIGKGELLCRKK
jgi:caffeoyl-CoA O-methyltransferase